MKVELLAPEETENILRKLANEESGSLGDFKLKGHFTMVCREEKTNEEVWRVDQDNLITNWARRLYFAAGEGLRQNANIFLFNFTETPDPRRTTLAFDSFSASGNIQLSSSNSSEHSRTWAHVFGTPGSPQTIAAVGINHDAQGYFDYYPPLTAYSRITPSKIQGTTQTLEISYKLFLLAVG